MKLVQCFVKQLGNMLYVSMRMINERPLLHVVDVTTGLCSIIGVLIDIEIEIEIEIGVSVVIVIVIRCPRVTAEIA